MSFKPTSGLSNLRRTASTPVQASDDAPTRTGLDTQGLRRSSGVEAKTLTTQNRKDLPDSAFVFPDKAPGSGSYPIPDLAHARNALSRSAGKPEEAAVKRAVYSKFPQLRS